VAHEEDGWSEFARKLDWTPSYVDERELFPEAMSGRPWLTQAEWAGWAEPYRTSFARYVEVQAEKEISVRAVTEALGRSKDVLRHDLGWLAAVKLHTATLPLAEFAAVIGNLRAARFGRDGAWRTTALFGGLDELRHTQIPLKLAHELVRWDPQFDWTHRFYHSNNWVAIAARHVFDELLLCADPIEFAIGTNFVFETGFTNLQFLGLTSLADQVDDHLIRSMLASIQSDEARHAQIGRPVLELVARHDRAYAQRLVDKWFWRSWLLFAIVTGFAMDYLTPLSRRSRSFGEFVREWVGDQFLTLLEEVGLERPFYWSTFERAVDNYHHMVYASAYSYRASVWFDFALPGPEERAWLARKYPESWPALEPVWQRIQARWEKTDPGLDLAVHATAIPTFCHLCQIVLAQGTPERNDAVVAEIEGQRHVFCSEPCRVLYANEPERYRNHLDVVSRVLQGKAPGNLIAFLTDYSGLSYEEWGKDIKAGVYPFVRRDREPR
jgi:toluene monooxygenase system protein A